MRSFRAERVSEFVHALLECEGHRARELLAAAAGAAVLTLWFGWALLRLGAAGTFLTNTSVTTVDAQAGNQLLKILLNFRVGGVAMVARVDPGVRVAPHENIRFAVDPERGIFILALLGLTNSILRRVSGCVQISGCAGGVVGL